ncbi:MAG: hypothetical protein M3O24_00135 [Thermoproteota archaeon]|nr:hypothetical protein [Thermoproteota archaeon]
MAKGLRTFALQIFLFVVAQNITISYVLVSDVSDVFTICHIKWTMRAFYETEVIRQFRRFFTIRANYFHTPACLRKVLNDRLVTLRIKIA